jgi:hypothetical protein
MKRVAVRLPSKLWQSVAWYGRTAGLLRPDGQLDVSETLRDLISRGLVSDRSTEAGYRAGYAAGKSDGYRDFMLRVAAASTAAVSTAHTSTSPSRPSKGNGR